MTVIANLRRRAENMSREAMYEIIRSPVITEKATLLKRAWAGGVSGGNGRYQAGKSAAQWKLCSA